MAAAFRLRDAPSLGARVLLVVALAALAYVAVRIGFAATEGRFAAGVTNLAAMAAAALIYLAGHAMRILRLALLIGGWRVGFREIASFHMMTAAVSLTMPLKLGEIYRVIEMSHVAGGFPRALATAWWERVFDVAFILIFLLIALANHSAAEEFLGVIALSAAFIGVTAIVFFVAPDNLRRLSVLIIRRYDDARAVPVMRLLDHARRAILEAPMLVRGKVASLMTLTALIWACEIACFAVVLGALGDSSDEALRAFLFFLSEITSGETLLHMLEAGGAIPAYLTMTQVPLALLGLVAGGLYVSKRLRV